MADHPSHVSNEELERKHNSEQAANTPTLRGIPADDASLFAMIDTLGDMPDAHKAPLPPLTSCAIQGGGAKGAAYAGTYEAMEKLGVTDTTTEYCGASAGAITDFLIGLGYDAEQFKAASDSMNFLDLNDFNASMFGRKAGGTKLSMLASVATQGFVHTGDGFHNWARAQCAMVYGNPDITFAELETWCTTQIPPVPVPDMKFMVTNLDKENGNSECISLSDKKMRNIVIADAVRASMSFPGAFRPFRIREKNSAGELVERGTFADGGILNNYPLDHLSKTGANSAYTLPEVHDIDSALEPMNPGAYGLSLTTHVQETTLLQSGIPESIRLKKLNGRPLNDREAALLEAAEKQDEAFKSRQLELEEKKGSLFKKIVNVLKKNIVGETPSSKNDNLKKRVFKNQTVLIYTEGVTTLEFQVSPQKKALIEASGKMAFINWFIEHRDPAQNYNDFFEKNHHGKAVENPYDADKFKGDAVLDTEDNFFIKETILPAAPQPIQLSDMEKYVRCMIDFHDELNNVQKIQKYLTKSEIMDELITDQQKKLKNFSNLNNNTRLKHLAWQLKKLEKKPEFKQNGQIKKQAIELINARKIRHTEKKQAVKDNLNTNISTEGLVAKINAHLAKKDAKAYDLVLMSTLPDNKPEQAEVGKLYLSADGSYIVREPQGIIRRGALAGSGVDTNNLENKITDPAFRKSILNITSKKGHTQANEIELALDIFKGQLSNMFKLMRADPTLLSKLAEKCDADQLKELLETIGRTAEQLEQQGRVFHQNYGMLAKLERETFENFNARFGLYLTTVTDPSLLYQAILQHDTKKIDYLLARSYINPLENSNEGKNALHACVDAEDVDTFKKIISQFDCLDLPYDPQGNTILHYIILHSKPGFIHALFAEPKIKDWIKALQKKDPECRAAFGLGDTLKDQIIEKARNNLSLDLTLINKTFNYKPIITSSTAKESDKNQAKLQLEKNKLISILGAEKMSAAVLNTYLSEPNKLDEKIALTLLTSPFNGNQTLLELAATDISAEQRYSKLALALLNKCEESGKNDKKLKAVFHSKFAGNKSLLYLAIEHNNADIVDKCLKYQSSINDAGPHECVSALTCAAKLGRVNLVEKLMKSKQDYSRALPDKEGKNGLHYLAKQEHPQASSDLLFKLLTKSSLITAGQTKKVDVPDATGKTVLDYLFRLNRLDVIQKITSQSTLRTWKLNDYFEGLFTPHLPGGRTSLEYLANLASTGSEHRALFIHVLKNISKHTKMKQDSQGKTPLHYLASCSKEEISAKEFVDFFKSKKTTYHSSAKYHRRTNIEDAQGNSVLRSLIANDRADIIKYLHANWSGWKLNAIFDLHTVRADGLSDMEYIQKLQATRPELEILKAINDFLPSSMKKSYNGEPMFHNEIVGNTKTAPEIWASLHSAVTTSSPTGIREKKADYTDVTSLRNSRVKPRFAN
jgi:predicted acylesterase/phospholipase RssA